MFPDVLTLSKSAPKNRWVTRALKVRKAPSYRAARWFFSDFVVRYRWRLSAITLIGFVAAGVQGLTLGALHGVTQMSSDASFNVPVLKVQLAPGQIAPAVAGFIIFALAVSAALSFVQGREVLRLWRRYQLHVVNALLGAVERAASRGAVDEASIKDASVLATLRQSQRLGAFTRIVASSITPALRFVVFAGIAVALSPRLTLVLFIVAIPSSWLTLMLFARGASHSARRVADLGRAASLDLAKRLDLTLQSQNALISAEQNPADSPFVDKVGALTRRIFLVEQAKFTTACIALLVSAGFVIYCGYTGALDSANWLQHFAYLLALLMAFNQLIGLASSVSNYGRFYPAVALYKDTLEILEQAASPDHLRQMARSRGLNRVELSDDDEMME